MRGKRSLGSFVLDVEIHEAAPSQSLTGAWRALAVAAENPFATPDWLAACLEVRQDARPLILACHSPDGRLVGVVPLVIDGRGRLGSAAEAYADWFGPACAPEDEAEVAVAVTSALHRSGHLGRSWSMTRCLTAAGWLAGVRRARHPEYELVPTDSEVELSLVRYSGPPAMSGKDRREIARLLRRLHDAHAVEFRCARTREEAETALPVFERLHAERWPDLRSADVAAFHRAFALRAADQEWLRLWTLELDGEPVAVLYGWRMGGRSFAYMQAFDAAWSRHAVGILLLDHAVRAAEQEGSEVFDMLRGKERHKARFENDQRTVRTYVIVGRGSFARLAIRGRESARHAYRRLPPRHRSALRRLLRLT
jgi:CelD/BcsL family acetyltransferase involved in cellulose biosynthesis